MTKKRHILDKWKVKNKPEEEKFADKEKRLGQTKMVATVECINVTSFEQSWRTLARSKAAVMFFQEHKVKMKERTRHKKELRNL